MEKDGENYYRELSEKTNQEGMRRILTLLANEEVKHLETFGKMFTEILGGTDWKQYIRDEVEDGEAPLITKLKENMKREDAKGEVEALRVGMELEENAIRFFTQASADADDTVAKKIFREISEEEKFHYDLLQAQYDSVTRSGFWLGSAEFQMDGKW